VRWNEAIVRYRTRIYTLRPKMSITIYGSFFPKKEKELLEKVVINLIDNGFNDSGIVGDRLRPIFENLTPYEASEFYLENSDVNFFIFTKMGKRLGVTSECEHLIRYPAMYSKWNNCVLFDQFVDDRGAIGQLIKDRLVKINQLRDKIPIIEFTQDEELLDATVEYAKDIVNSMRYILQIR